LGNDRVCDEEDSIWTMALSVTICVQELLQSLTCSASTSSSFVHCSFQSNQIVFNQSNQLVFKNISKSFYAPPKRPLTFSNVPLWKRPSYFTLFGSWCSLTWDRENYEIHRCSLWSVSLPSGMRRLCCQVPRRFNSGASVGVPAPI
jgi:hypothetical protein